MERVAYPDSAIECQLKVFLGDFVGQKTVRANLAASEIGKFNRVARSYMATSDCNITKFGHGLGRKVGSADEVAGFF